MTAGNLDCYIRYLCSIDWKPTEPAFAIDINEMIPHDELQTTLPVALIEPNIVLEITSSKPQACNCPNSTGGTSIENK